MYSLISRILRGLREMEREPLISVIIPVYGVEKYIRECLDSVIRQTYRNLEIIVINDGTKDRSAEIAKEYAKLDPRIKVYDFANGGLSVARNRGLNLSTGSYIAFLDSDDWLMPNMYEELMTSIIEHNADFVKCSVIEADTILNNQKTITFDSNKEIPPRFTNIISEDSFTPWFGMPFIEAA